MKIERLFWGIKTGKPLETLAVFGLQSFRPHVLAGLTEMNLRRNYEGDFKTESSKKQLKKRVSGTFETKNKGWPK